MKLGIIIIGAVAVIVAVKLMSRKFRFDGLMAKYNDAELVDRLMGREFWHGMSKGMLRDSLGVPLKVDQEVQKTKTREVWRYAEARKARVAKKIILENEEVIGWDLN